MAFTPALLAGSRIFQMDEISKSLRMHCYRCSPSATPTCIIFAPQNTMHPESPLHCPHSPNDRGTLFKSPRSPASVGEGTLSSLQAGVDPGFLSGAKDEGGSEHLSFLRPWSLRPQVSLPRCPPPSSSVWLLPDAGRKTAAASHAQ